MWLVINTRKTLRFDINWIGAIMGQTWQYHHHLYGEILFKLEHEWQTYNTCRSLSRRCTLIELSVAGSGNLSDCFGKAYAGNCHRVGIAGSASLIHVVQRDVCHVYVRSDCQNMLLKLEAFNLVILWLIIASNLKLVGGSWRLHLIGCCRSQLTPLQANRINLPASARGAFGRQSRP
jgi:hypothetical protein